MDGFIGSVFAVLWVALRWFALLCTAVLCFASLCFALHRDPSLCFASLGFALLRYALIALLVSKFDIANTLTVRGPLPFFHSSISLHLYSLPFFSLFHSLPPYLEEP